METYRKISRKLIYECINVYDRDRPSCRAISMKYSHQPSDHLVLIKQMVKDARVYQIKGRALIE